MKETLPKPGAFIHSPLTRRPLGNRLLKCSATFGNGPIVPTLRTQDTRPQLAPLANITANSCVISTSLGAARALLHSLTSARRTVTFSRLMPAGSSPDFAWPEPLPNSGPHSHFQKLFSR